MAEGVGIGGQWCPPSAVDVGAPGSLAGLEDAGSEEVTTGKLEMSVVTIFVGWKVNEREKSVVGAIVGTVGQEDVVSVLCSSREVERCLRGPVEGVYITRIRLNDFSKCLG